jgi:hypothetical protein
MRRLWISGLVAGLAGLAVSGVSLASGSAPAGGASHTLVARDTLRSFQFIDNGRNGVGVGDGTAFTKTLENRSGTRVIGSADGSCVITRAHAGTPTAAECAETFTINHVGTIQTQLLDHLVVPLDVAIVGGTDSYAGARGELNISVRGTIQFDTFRYQVP